MLNSLLLSCAAATVFLGTLYPLFLDIAGGAKISVGPPYFTITAVPLLLAIAALAGVGPILAWRRGSLRLTWRRLWPVAAAAGAGAVILIAWPGLGLPPAAVAGFGVALWLGGSVAADIAGQIRQHHAIGAGLARIPRRTWGMALAHWGAAALIIGATGAGALQSETIAALRPGERATIAGHSVTFEQASVAAGPNYTALRGHYTVRDGDGNLVARLAPERRRYTAPPQETTEAAIHSAPWRDIHAVIGAGNPDDGFVARLYSRPLAMWLWIGGALMALGGAVALSDRRRIGPSAPGGAS